MKDLTEAAAEKYARAAQDMGEKAIDVKLGNIRVTIHAPVEPPQVRLVKALLRQHPARN
jgi:hypothetical protein